MNRHVDHNDPASLAAEISRLYGEKEELEAAVKVVKKQMEPIEKRIVELFAERDIDKVSCLGRTVFVRVDRRASIIDNQKQEACDAIKEIGHGHIVAEGFNHNTLSAICREYLDGDEGKLPDELAKYIKINEIPKVSCVKSGK